ncbi:non-hydrolyzing UDP-N-acetylglucosamine 2-epimerase [Flavobacterium sp. 2]|uniref:non-hydrolyzing UDP-N-acetylglucosamine 2-epimerase n=1 Tax=Flavobacterium sp. 2 TaxID=308053 RepID=UPI003CEC9D8C
MKVDIIAGTRPNFIKIAPLVSALQLAHDSGKSIDFRLIHTGQHYDENMSESFFKQLNIPRPDINFGAGGGSQAVQTSAILVAYEELLLKEPTDLCIVVGDVNSTMACAIAARKANIPVAHVEAGIRSFDNSMPEEINRKITDSISNYFFTTTVLASENLKKEGIDENNIFLVGNVMIDTLLKNKDKFIKPIFWDEYLLEKKNFLLLTIHRPSNVNNKEKLKNYIINILSNSEDAKIIFPVHPRTIKAIEELDIKDDRLIVVPPMSYLEFNYLVMNSKAVITDSGGITEETTVMGVPCITLRDNTERPETVTIGTNELIGTNPEAIKPVLEKLFSGNWKKGSIPELWDGKTAERIIDIIVKNNL